MRGNRETSDAGGARQRPQDHLRRLAHEHLVALEGHRANYLAKVLEVNRHVISVGPDTDLGIVGERVELESVAEVRTGGIRGGGDGDTLEEGGAAGDRKLAQQPTVGQTVVEHHWIAIVVRLAWPTEPSKQRAGRGGTE